MFTDERLLMMFGGVFAAVYFIEACNFGIAIGNKGAVVLALLSAGAAFYATLRKSYEARRPEGSFGLPIARVIFWVANASGLASFASLAGLL